MEVWFYTGLEMKDGTKRSICAIDDAQVAEYESKGFKRVEPDKPIVSEKAAPKVIKNVVASKKKPAKKAKVK